MKYFLLSSDIIYLTGLSCFPRSPKVNAVPGGADFFAGEVAAVQQLLELWALGICERTTLPKGLLHGFQECKSINMCTAAARHRASHHLVVNRKL